MIRINKPKLDRRKPEENLAIVERWINETADQLNVYLAQLEREIKNGNKEDKPD